MKKNQFLEPTYCWNKRIRKSAKFFGLSKSFFFKPCAIYSTTEQDIYELKIIDIAGKLIDNLSFKGKQYTYQNKDLSTGLYFYEITNENKVKSRVNW